MQRKAFFFLTITILIMSTPALYSEATAPQVSSSQMRYLESNYASLKQLHFYLLAQEDEDISLEELEIIEGKKREHMKNLREALFKKPEKILAFYQLRTEIFRKHLAEKEREYLTVKEAKTEEEKLLRDQTFQELQATEAKVLHLTAMAKRLDRQIFERELKKKFNRLVKDYKRYSRYDQGRAATIKKDMLVLLEEVAVRYHYPLDVLERIQQKKEGFEQLLGVYSHWGDAEEDRDAEYVRTDDPEYKESVPIRRDDDFSMVGRDNYIHTVTTKKLDRRLHDHKKNPTNIRDKATEYTTSERREVRKKYRDYRREQGYSEYAR